MSKSNGSSKKNTKNTVEYENNTKIKRRSFIKYSATTSAALSFPLIFNGSKRVKADTINLVYQNWSARDGEMPWERELIQKFIGVIMV